MSESGVCIFPSIDANGLIDQFGNGQVVDNAAAYFPIPNRLMSQPQSAWYLGQWGQPAVLSPTEYALHDYTQADDVFHIPTYSWSNRLTSESFSIFNGDPSGTGAPSTVYGLEDGNGVNEADIFLSSPSVPNGTYTFDHPITFSMNAKISKVLFSYLAGAQEDQVTGNIDIGFEVDFNGSGGLPEYNGFVQIIPMTHDVDPVGSYNPTAHYAYSYSSAPISPTNFSQFIYSNLFNGDAYLPGLAADSFAAMDTLTYNVNKYVYSALQDAFVNFSLADKAILLNLGNWSLGEVYVGLATANQQIDTPVSGNADLGVQFSDISVTSDQSVLYDQSDPPLAVPIGDINPQISFYDSTMGIGGEVDGSYAYGLTGLINRYIYEGNDSLTLNAPSGNDWMFGGGNGATVLNAIDGDNIFVASTGGSFMTSGSGSDIFTIPYSPHSNPRDTISNFHSADKVILFGVTPTTWTYAWTTSSNGTLVFTASEVWNPKIKDTITFTGYQQSEVGEFVVGVADPETAGVWAGCTSITLSSDAFTHQTDLQKFDLNNKSSRAENGLLSENLPTIAIYHGSLPMSFVRPSNLDDRKEINPIGSQNSGIFHSKNGLFDTLDHVQPVFVSIPQSEDRNSSDEGGLLFLNQNKSLFSGLFTLNWQGHHHALT